MESIPTIYTSNKNTHSSPRAGKEHALHIVETYNLNGKEYPITGFARVVDENHIPTGETIPIVDIPQISDFDWQYNCLVDRMKNPEKYQKYDKEDVPACIERLKEWLKAHANTPQEKAKLSAIL